MSKSQGLTKEKISGYLNEAFQSRDVDQICQAIGLAVKTHNISEVAGKVGIHRPF